QTPTPTPAPTPRAIQEGWLVHSQCQPYSAVSMSATATDRLYGDDDVNGPDQRVNVAISVAPGDSFSYLGDGAWDENGQYENKIAYDWSWDMEGNGPIPDDNW